MMMQNMKHNRGYRVLCIVMLLVMLSSSFTFAASKLLVKEYTFTSSSSEQFAYTAKEHIKEDGVTYKLTDVQYEVIGENENYISKEVTYDNLNAEEVPLEETFNINGKDITLKLSDDDIAYTEEIKYVTETYTKQTTKPTIPSEKKVVADDATYIATLENVKESSTTKAYTAKVKFIGAEGSTYYLNNKALTMDGSSPLWSGYESDVISYLGLPKGSTVTSGKWTTGYVTEGEDVVRYAEFSGTRPAANYTATYSYAVYSCKAVYDNGEDPYEVKAICTYEASGWSTAAKVAVGAAVVILAGLIVFILYMIAKKKKQEEE